MKRNFLILQNLGRPGSRFNGFEVKAEEQCEFCIVQHYHSAAILAHKPATYFRHCKMAREDICSSHDSLSEKIEGHVASEAMPFRSESSRDDQPHLDPISSNYM